MFDVGFWELLIIALLALMVLGPERLPGIVKTAGNWAGRARFMARSLRMQIEQEMAQEVNAKKTAEAQTKARPPADATDGGPQTQADAPPDETPNGSDPGHERESGA